MTEFWKDFRAEPVDWKPTSRFDIVAHIKGHYDDILRLLRVQAYRWTDSTLGSYRSVELAFATCHVAFQEYDEAKGYIYVLVSPMEPATMSVARKLLDEMGLADSQPWSAWKDGQSD